MNITARMRGPLAIKLRFQPGMKGEKGDAGDAATVAVGAVTTGAPGSPAAVTNVGTAAAAIFDFDIPEGDKGDAGDNGWTPELATVTDSARRVHQVVDWFGGTGTKPATGDYVGATGLTPTIGDAVDIRGPAGTAAIPDGDKGDITTSTGGDVWQINAGAVGTTELADKAATNAKLADMATARIKGRATAGSGAPEDLTGAQVTAMLDAFVGDTGSGGTKGLTPAPGAGDNAAGRVLDASGGFVSLANKHMPMGSVVDCVSATFAAVTSSNVIIPLDDTKPQISEGSEILSVAIAPKSTSNKLRVLAVLPFSLSGGAASAIAALFRTGTTDALAAIFRYDAAGAGGVLVLTKEFTPATTASVTLSVRVGVDIAGRAVVINGINGPARLLGGASEASIFVEEIKA